MTHHPERETVDTYLEQLALQIPSCYLMSVTNDDGQLLGQWQVESSNPSHLIAAGKSGD
ncbi:MAG: hypothetical protein AAGK74_08480 [Chloroflexota bacterium]